LTEIKLIEEKNQQQQQPIESLLVDSSDSISMEQQSNQIRVRV
jgi:hypothetical protein